MSAKSEAPLSDLPEVLDSGKVLSYVACCRIMAPCRVAYMYFCIESGTWHFGNLKRVLILTTTHVIGVRKCPLLPLNLGVQRVPF